MPIYATLEYRDVIITSKGLVNLGVSPKKIKHLKKGDGTRITLVQCATPKIMEAVLTQFSPPAAQAIHI